MRKSGVTCYPCPLGCGFMHKIGPYHPNDDPDVTWIFWQCKKCTSTAHTDATTGEVIDVVEGDTPLAHFGKCTL